MPPRIIQWEPVESFDELYFVPRDGKEDVFAQRAAELGVTVTSQVAQIYAPGTNIDGGWIDVGEPIPFATMRDGTVEQLARMAVELVDVCRPTKFLVSDYDGWRAIHVEDDIVITNVADWRQYLADENKRELLVDAVTEGIAARSEAELRQFVTPGRKPIPRLEDLEDLEVLARIAPRHPKALTLLAQHYRSLDRLDDAARVATQLCALDVRDHRKAPAHTVLGEVAAARGDVKAALAAHQTALKMAYGVAAQLAVGVAAIRAGDLDLARKTLANRNRGRSLFELAESMCKMGRADDARAYLEVALDLDRELLKPVPDNQWPKPPNTTWTEAHADLANLVANARSRHG
ncbi:MAG: tetratricopeptide repeat protein [Kofleriaceae bacterium]